MDELSKYHDAATRSVSVAKVLFLLAEAARRDIPLSKFLESASDESLKKIRSPEEMVTNLDAALSQAESVPDAVRLAVMRAGNGRYQLLGQTGVNAHDTAIALGRHLLPKPEYRLREEQDYSLTDLATARMVNIHAAHGDAYHCLKEAESALEAERLGAAEASKPPRDKLPKVRGKERGKKDGGNRYQALGTVKAAERKAYLSFLYAETKMEKRCEDKEAYDWLQENGTEDGQSGELTDYEFPSFDTWSRQLRTARKATGEQKYTPRHAKSGGKSIVDADSI